MEGGATSAFGALLPRPHGAIHGRRTVGSLSIRPSLRSVGCRSNRWLTKRRCLMQKSKAVCLLSGGLDSATSLAIAQAEGFETHGMSFEYGQRHAWELKAAKRIA